MTDSPPILVIEDTEEDYEACAAALTGDGQLAHPVVRAETGDEALGYLYRRGRHADPPAARPCLVLLDLNLPGTSGHKVLERMKSDSDLCDIPVVVMTSSEAEEDVQACYRLGANSYVVKPVSLGRFLTAVTQMRDYWFRIALLPGS